MSIMTESGFAGFLVGAGADLTDALGAAGESTVDSIPLCRLGIT